MLSVFAESNGPLKTSLSWYGSFGPFAGTNCNDALLTSMTGALKGFGPAQGPPLLPAGHQAQIIGGTTTFIGTLGHLLARSRGKDLAAVLEISVLESNLCLTEAGAPGVFNAAQCPIALESIASTPRIPAAFTAAQTGGWA